MVLAKEHDRESLRLSVCAPDMHRPSQYNMSFIPEEMIPALSKLKRVKLTVRGRWKVATDHPEVRIVEVQNGQTVVELDCIDTKTIEVELQSIQPVSNSEMVDIVRLISSQ